MTQARFDNDEPSYLPPPILLASPVNLALPASKRLKTPAQFQDVYKSKQWGGSKHYTFNVLACQPDGDQTSQLGVTVSKKVSKLAVDRNRIKRQIKEFYRHHQAELLNAQLVITAKPSARHASDKDRLASLEELWSKVLKWQRWHQRQNADQTNHHANGR